MLDEQGYRPNVGIVLLNTHNQVFWGKRIEQHAWQFPQGGIDDGETPEEAMYRELWEEVGLHPNQVRIIGRTRDWLRYHVPEQWVRREWRGTYKGQKQIWFALRMVAKDHAVNLRATNTPEFDAWRWAEYWINLDHVIEFKRSVYALALKELHPVIAAESQAISQMNTDVNLGVDINVGVDVDVDVNNIFNNTKVVNTVNKDL